jgi:hypothetical protein
MLGRPVMCSMDPAPPEGQTVALRGGEVHIRPVEPEDKAALAAGFERLSPESRYRRFLSPKKELSSHDLAYLTEVDHHDHESLAGFDAGAATASASRASSGRPPIPRAPRSPTPARRRRSRQGRSRDPAGVAAPGAAELPRPSPRGGRAAAIAGHPCQPRRRYLARVRPPGGGGR